MMGATALWLSVAHAAEPADDAVIVVEDTAVPHSATERRLDHDAVVALPGRSVDDRLRAMSGLHQSSHGGHGKAYQYFLRGFDAVHGTDLAVSVEGIPLNEVSNVHGHGYLDLHLLPPVLLSGMTLRPGTWNASVGSFAVAGSADLSLGLAHPGGLASLTLGTDRSVGLTAAWRPREAPAGTFFVVDADVGQGNGEARSFRQLRAGAGVEGDVGALHARAFALAYDGAFESPGVLRLDDLQSGEVGFYDAYDGSGGGRSSRALGGVELVGTGVRSVSRVTLWGSLRRLSLEQNFTGFNVHPEQGDGSLQIQRAATMGLEASSSREVSSDIAVRAGLSARADFIDQREQGIDTQGIVWEDRYAAKATQSATALWTQAELRPARWLTVAPGLRAEVFTAWVDRKESSPTTSWAPVLAPKLRTTWFGEERVSLFASYGRGYRSPEARALGDSPRAPLSVADAGEVGLIAELTPALSARSAVFLTRIDNELLFDHVAARFLTTGTTRRVGVDAGLTLRPVEHVRLEGQITVSDARYTTTGARIPFAPPVLGVVGLYTERLPLGGAELTAGVRGWVLGPRPLPGGFVSAPTGTADLSANLDWERIGLSLDFDNAVGAKWRDGEFLFASRWDLDQPSSELPARHITAGSAPTLRVGVQYRF